MTAPVLYSSVNQEVDSGDTFVCTLSGYDPDYVVTDDGGTVVVDNLDIAVTQPGHSLSWSIAGGADFALFSLANTAADGASVELSITAQDADVPADANFDGVYEVTLLLTDGDGETATVTLYVRCVGIALADPDEYSIHHRILSAVTQIIKDIGLDGIDDGNIVMLKADRRMPRRELGTPGIGVMHDGNFETYDDGSVATNRWVEIGWPVWVVVFDTDREDGRVSQSLSHDERLYWRQQIVQAFAGKRLSTVSEVHDCRPQSTRVFDDALWRQGIWFSPVLLNFKGRL